ncbi:hypothetical protein CJD36_022515 [Flavipsychrobacter stenotrophus]|uniref:Uncharacterized protein n=1 Tax=Flavipsychrobacter stenotrophus TaxID=2077091 RepID=A0A2S7SQ95_9BACT|nr:T9SS type A sorting domain-containing protein [Flavipsychrobacter stenotrophus]PQJ08775.1 hypothetical protein CJD36_022515 [Flavipsychrobacter stenotrophus]
MRSVLRLTALIALMLPLFTKGQVIVNVAGNLNEYYSGDGGPATTASLANPYGISVSKQGNVYIADHNNFVVRKVGTDGIITTVAGNHTYGYSGNGGPATAAQLMFPWDVAVDDSENLYIADMANQVVRKVSHTGIISTFAGNHTYSFSGDGGPATAAGLANPQCVAVDRYGNVYISDGGNNRIRKVDTAGTITTVTGNGTPGLSGDGGPASLAMISHAAGMAFDTAGNLYFSDKVNYKVRKISTAGIISTVAGIGTEGFSGDGGPATAAQFRGPEGLAVDKSGTIYAADGENDLIRKIDPLGVITTICGHPLITGYSGNYVLALGAVINYPIGMSMDTAGTLYFANIGSNLVQKIIMNCAPASIMGTDTLCIGASVTFTDSIAGGSWSLSSVTTATITASGVVTGVAQGGNNIIYTTNNICGVQSRLQYIYIEAPAQPITGADSLCTGSTALFANGSFGGMWTCTNAHTTITAGGLATGISTGTDTISYLLTNSCGVSSAVKGLEIIPPVHLSPIVGRDSICTFVMIVYTDSIMGGVWTNNNSLGSILGGHLTGFNAGIDTLKYTVTYTAPLACVVQVKKAVVISSAPPSTFTISGVDSICPGDSAVLSVPGGGMWYVQNGNATVSSSGITTGVSPGVDVITYTLTNGCGSVSKVKTIRVRTEESCAHGVSVASLTNEDINIYPNPAVSMLYISSPNKINHIAITDVPGKYFLDRDYNTGSIALDVSSLPPGLYFLRINGDVVRKFVKE